jgi:hypothetical protein
MINKIILIYIVLCFGFCVFSLNKIPVKNGVVDYTANDGHNVWDVQNLNDILSLYSDNELKEIKVLFISHTKISKIEKLNKLVNLEWLELSISKIEKIEGLDNLVNLKRLNLSTNNITKIEGLSNLTRLNELLLSENKITKIEGLDNLSELTTLVLGCNIQKIENLDKLTKLLNFSLGDNKIEVLENFNFLETRQDNFIHLMLWNNPLKRIDKTTFDLFNRLKMFDKIYKVKEEKVQLKTYYDNAGSEILSLKKDDIVYGVPGANIDTHKDTLQNIKGYWKQVITSDLQIGWCFDGFLEKLEDTKYFTPKVEKLRLRETQDQNGKIIRMLFKGEKLEVLVKGKGETISGIKGNWVKVILGDGISGWCFDGYLEEVNDNEVKKK